MVVLGGGAVSYEQGSPVDRHEQYMHGVRPDVLECRWRLHPQGVEYRGTSLIRNPPLLGPYRLSRVLWWS